LLDCLKLVAEEWIGEANMADLHSGLQYILAAEHIRDRMEQNPTVELVEECCEIMVTLNNAVDTVDTASAERGWQHVAGCLG